MNNYEPLKTLTDKYNVYIRARDKSIASYQRKSISKELHDTHMLNLNKLISDYESAIDILLNHYHT